MTPLVTAITELLKLLDQDQLKELDDHIRENSLYPTVEFCWAKYALLESLQLPDEEKIAFDLVLEKSGPNRISLIKVIRQRKLGIGLYEAKMLTEDLPKTLAEGLTKSEAEEFKKDIISVGGEASIK